MSIPKFKNPRLLELALTHRSAVNEPRFGNESNERLEYLGDAVLELITSEYLFHRFPREPEGKLTAYRSALVKTDTLAQLAKELGLDRLLKLSRGEAKSGGRENPSLLADTTEAVIGALYLDQGLKTTREFLKKHLFTKLPAILKEKAYLDPKSHLQELVQAQKLPTPKYRVIKASGPDHKKTFTVAVMVDDQVVGEGTGQSKRQAQQQAARLAIEKYT